MNQQQILTALGINPGTVKADTVRIRFVGENVLVEYDCAIQVTGPMFAQITSQTVEPPEFDAAEGLDKVEADER